VPGFRETEFFQIFSSCPTLIGNRVIAAFTKRIATDSPMNCQPTTFYYAVFLDGLVAIVGTTWVISAGVSRKQLRQRKLVYSYQSQKGVFHYRFNPILPQINWIVIPNCSQFVPIFPHWLVLVGQVWGVGLLLAVTFPTIWPVLTDFRRSGQLSRSQLPR